MTKKDTRKWYTSLLNTAKCSAKRRGHTVSLTTQDLRDIYESQAGLCYWTGYPMVRTNGRTGKIGSRRFHPTAVSIDRLDCEEGYNLGNVVLTCSSINGMRGTKDVDFWGDFCKVTRDSLQNLLRTEQICYDKYLETLEDR